MNSEKLIHIKLEHPEAVQSKRDILSSEMNLLRISRALKNYQSLRLEELNQKLKLHKKLKELKAFSSKLQQLLPKIQIPEILKKEEEETDKIETKIKKTKEKQYDKSLEIQLQDIQEKLRALEQ